MGCYRCGSGEGSESQLCPTCAQIRKVQREAALKNGQNAKGKRGKKPRSLLEAVLSERRAAFAVFGALAVIILSLILLFNYIRTPALTPAGLESLYSNCVRVLKEQLMVQGNSSEDGSGAGSDIRETIRSMLRQGVSNAGGPEGACSFLRDKCMDNPHGGECEEGMKRFLEKAK